MGSDSIGKEQPSPSLGDRGELKEIEREVTLLNTYGLHARPATMLVQAASGFEAEISICKDKQEVDGKSVLNLMMLGAEKGTILKIRAVGRDAEEAVGAIEALVLSKFNEE